MLERETAEDAKPSVLSASERNAGVRLHQYALVEENETTGWSDKLRENANAVSFRLMLVLGGHWTTVQYSRATIRDDSTWQGGRSDTVDNLMVDDDAAIIYGMQHSVPIVTSL
jgi:hypothetical protein